MTYYETLVELAQGEFARGRHKSSWDIYCMVGSVVWDADMGRLLTEDPGMVLEMIDHGVDIELRDDDFKKRAVEVSIEDVLRELLREKLTAVLNEEWRRARMDARLAKAH